MKIAIIGWGSLIWDLDDLTPKVTGAWQRETGPVLPIEFSRISPKRLGALAAVIDPEYGDPCKTSVIDSRATTLQQAVTDLAARERTSEDQIGRVDARAGEARAAHPAVAKTALDWCRETGADAAVWTDLQPNYGPERDAPFTIQGAIHYLQSLRGPALAEARRYITEAPAETDTPLRRALLDDAWWQSLG